jgi:hypothetical protein
LLLFATKDAKACQCKESDLESCWEKSATIHGACSLAGQTRIDHARLSIPKKRTGVCRFVLVLDSWRVA